MTIPEMHRRAVRGMSERIAAIEAGQWELPTPCDDWDVSDLVGHVVYEMLWTPPVCGGVAIEQVGDAFEGDVLGDDPYAAWEATVAPALEAAAEPGVLDRTVHLSFGDFPGRFYLSQLLTDLLVHTWDVARATDGDECLDPDLVAWCLEWFGDYEESYRVLGAIGPRVDVPSSSDEQTLLLAAFGRDPR